MKTTHRLLISGLLTLLAANAGAQEALTHKDLVALFADWRAFESPPSLNGAPDYTAERFAIRQPEYQELRARLDAFDVDGLPVPPMSVTQFGPSAALTTRPHTFAGVAVAASVPKFVGGAGRSAPSAGGVNPGWSAQKP